MFTKILGSPKTEAEDTSAGRNVPSTTARQPAGRRPGIAGRAAAPSVISADMHIVGDVRTQGDVQIDGTVDGELSAAHITVGESGSVNGEVVADSVEIWGKIAGHVHANDVSLKVGAEVYADIVYKAIEIPRGALVEGALTVMDGTSAQRNRSAVLTYSKESAYAEITRTSVRQTETTSAYVKGDIEK
ncbi:polymer-forming cytoskeletal protein [Thiohalocapsa marina]|uniref:Polymer-forming cytoskeletal protein n=1 Tax=Thiohalocapsa marina TaxID=424902 RepID=A0A5M8FSS6_9GAMM|nr:polymer-forming cytoskeletal protein [Thiohalocapsa marina]KAA6185812.1 polymer-forming cytoskeletal protein [Thiohalocapsa marina]